MNLNLLNTFLKVSELKSFTQAAKILQQPKSRVSRNISQLERDLKIDLIKRTTRSFSLTTDGERLYRETKPILLKLLNRVDQISNSQNDIQGTLSLTGPIDIGQTILPKLLNKFSSKYPKIQFQLHLTDHYVDLAGMNIDVGIRVGNLKDSTMKQKILAKAKLILVCSPEYLGKDSLKFSVKDLQDYSIISFYNENQTDPLTKIYKEHKIVPRFRVNSFPTIKNMMMQNMGIGILPDIICQQELREKKLIQLLPHWSYQKSTIQAVYSNSKNISPKIRAFIDFLIEEKQVFQDLT
ncbi:LysR family transcriptional regulator [Bacteriovoracaceae bacterium]|nr:LysR family transcriptional regulator [Bacteriovoracaceae bacterium]